MNEYGPARGAPPDFNECQYCNKRFASGAARRSHEETSNFCIAQQVMGRMLREIQTNDGGQHEAKKQKQEPAADEWEDLGGDNRDAEEKDGGDTWDPEEEAPQPFEAQVDAMVEAAFEEEGEGGAAESDTGGLNEGGPSKTEREFDSVEELVLAFQTAGRKQRPLTPAGMYRILRVLNHEDYDPSEVAKELKDAGRVTKMVAEMTIATKVNMVDLAEAGDPSPLWCAYIEGTYAFKHMFSEPEAADGFFLRPKPLVDENRRNAEGGHVRIYGEVRRGTWWEKANQLVVDREKKKEPQERMETPAVYAGSYILHYDKTHLDAVGNYIMAPLYMSLGNYSRKFIGNARKGYVLVALLPIPKPEAFAVG